MRESISPAHIFDKKYDLFHDVDAKPDVALAAQVLVPLLDDDEWKEISRNKLEASWVEYCSEYNISFDTILGELVFDGRLIEHAKHESVEATDAFVACFLSREAGSEE